MLKVFSYHAILLFSNLNALQPLYAPVAMDLAKSYLSTSLN